MNAIGYTRLSAKDQSKYSLSDQEASIRDYCSRNNLDLTALFKDNGQCSDTFDRADFMALEAFIKKHKGNVRYLIVMAHDRFSRDISEALGKIKSFEQKYRLKVLSIDEPLDLDPDDPDVFIHRAFKYLMANQELLSIRKRTRRGIRNALESGRYVNMAPVGYKNERDAEGKSILVVVEEKAEIIQEIFRKYLKGMPIGQIHTEAKRDGLNRSGNSVIPRILSTSLYAGLIKLPASLKQPERYVKAIHTPIISESDFWLAQQMLDNRIPLKTHLKSDFPLRGILKCWCGHHMTAAWSKGKSKQYVYYFCKQHRAVNVSGAKLHKQFREILEHLSLTEEHLNYLTTEINEHFKVALELQVKQLALKSSQLKEVDNNIDRLEAKFMKEEIESVTYKKWYKKYNIERAELTSAIIDLKQDNSSHWKELRKKLPLLTNIPKVYEGIDAEQQFMLIKTVFDHGLVYLNGTVRTPKINPVFSHNSLILKEKGLLYIEQPSDIWEKTPTCSEVRDRT